MRRRSALVALAVLVGVAVLTGCGGGADAARRSAEAGSETSVTGGVTVLAAASLTEVFTELGRRFEAAHPGTQVTFSFAASSELATQVVNGAPADVFASASTTTMQQVADSGAVAGEPVVFARNRLQIAVPPDDPGEVSGLGDFARRDLAVALCAPEVPCGAAAVQALRQAGVDAAVDTYEQDVKAALTKVEIGEVDAALVYRTDVRAAGDAVRGVDFPESAEAVNDYPVAVLVAAPNPRAARAFVGLVRSASGARVLTGAGFELP